MQSAGFGMAEGKAEPEREGAASREDGGRSDRAREDRWDDGAWRPVARRVSASTSLARASGPRAAMALSSASTASTASPGAMVATGTADAASPASASSKSRSLACRDRAQPDIGGKRIEIEAPAAIDDHRDLGRKREPGVGDGLAKVSGKFVRIDQRGGIVGQRIGDDRHALADVDVERGDRSGKARRRERREPADLEAAARADLHRAVAVRARRLAEADERIERHRRDGKKAHQQAVARFHRGRQAGTGAADVGAGHGDASA